MMGPVSLHTVLRNIEHWFRAHPFMQSLEISNNVKPMWKHNYPAISFPQRKELSFSLKTFG